jgi:inorganic pyrophosphatase
MEIPAKFWHLLDEMVLNNQIIIDRPKGSSHPRYPDFIYPLDYGHLANTHSSDGDAVDTWLGSLNNRYLGGVVCTVDQEDRDVEMKLLLGCTLEEMLMILEIHNQGSQAAFFAKR